MQEFHRKITERKKKQRRDTAKDGIAGFDKKMLKSRNCET